MSFTWCVFVVCFLTLAATTCRGDASPSAESSASASASAQDYRLIHPLGRVDGLTFAKSLGFDQHLPTSLTSSSVHVTSFSPPVVFPPHAPTAHLTPYSVFAHTAGLRPTAPALHAAQGVVSFYGGTDRGDRGKPIVHQLQPVTTLHGVPVLQEVSVLNHGPVLHGEVHNSIDYLQHNARLGGGPYGCGGYGTCQPLAACAWCFDALGPQSQCSLYGGAPGVCCPDLFKLKHSGPEQRLFMPPNLRIKTPDFSVYQLNEAAKSGLWQVAERDKMEQTLRRNSVAVTDQSTPEYRHLQFFRTSPRARRFARAAVTVERSSNFLMYRYQLTPLQAGFGLRQFAVGDTILSDTCAAKPPCGQKEEYYRTIDGSCNNLLYPSWGQARTALQRILPPHYEDGLFEPRGGRDNRQLPSARTVSISNVADVDSPDLGLTLAVMQWGQFIDHDLTHVPIFRFDNQSGIKCCEDNGDFMAASQTHPACLPIAIPADDPFFSSFRRSCMSFVRSMPTQNENCTFGSSEQMNQVTHYLDGSNVYGSSGDDENTVRVGRGGLLNVQGRALLPADPDSNLEECGSATQAFHCFLAGDNRVNEQPNLAVFHTIWMREHNRLALQLAKINPHWDDETLYQEARRIVVAQMQHIIYNEWLPIIIGKECVINNRLAPLQHGYTTDYSPRVEASIMNEFSAAAFRFGHTLVQGMMHLFGKNHHQTDTLNLHEHFNSPYLLYTPGKLDEFLRGLSKQPMQKFDNHVTSELTNRLFQGRNMLFGMDLISLNIQRGRDHGLPPYNALREACGLPRARRFKDLRDVMSERAIQRLRGIYASVEDIDIFIAGILERPVPGAVLGPTFKCVVADQFTRLKRGDRFFYENGNQVSSFTEAQLHEIRRTSWARIVCNNGDHITALQPLAMRTASQLNQKVACSSPAIPRLDLTPWISVSH